jgi:plastocyanin
VRPRARAAALALALLGSAGLGGCGERRAGERATTTPRAVPQAGPGVVVVSLAEYRLDPPTARVARPGTITFVATNDGAVAHALAVTGPSGERRTRALQPGEHATLRLNLPLGTFKWACPIDAHERLGMTGRVRVGQR